MTLHAVVVFWLKQTKQGNTELALPQNHHKRELHLENLNFTLFAQFSMNASTSDCATASLSDSAINSVFWWSSCCWSCVGGGVVAVFAFFGPGSAPWPAACTALYERFFRTSPL